MDLPQIDDYQNLFLSDTPMLDVRAPVEYQQGAFPFTENIPLMNDDERCKVGIRYKESGQDKAIELGHSLVSGHIKENRVAHWIDFTQQHPHGALYCFRGGMRSRICQQWIYDKTGTVYPRVKGGYKALRRYLIDQLETAVKQIRPLVLSGRTGVGKTLLLKRIEHHIDLEGIYNHRGSAFGKHVFPQSCQIDIENKLAIALLKRRNHMNNLVLEDEARNIGSRRLPENLVHNMKQSPLVLLEASIGERVDIIFREYIIEALAEYQTMLGDDEGFNTWSQNLLTALDKIQRRLGGLRHKQTKSVMQDAIHKHRDLNQAEHHKSWIRELLTEYYDPMYDYQLSKKTDRVIFRGDNEAVLHYIKQQQPASVLNKASATSTQ